MGEVRAVVRPARALDDLWRELAAWVEARGIGGSVHRYGPADDQHGVLRLPPTPPPHPVAIVIHGGFWRAPFTRSNTEALAVALAQAGWATWNIEYRRIGTGGGYPETLADVASACRALRELDPTLDPDAVVGVGHSAGGQLALWAAAERLVAGVVSLAGVCDLGAAAREGLGDGAVAEFLGGRPEAAEHRYACADPARRLPLAVPSLLVHGSNDDRVPIAQSRGLAAAASAAGDDCRLLELHGADHFDLIDPRSPNWPAIATGIGELLSRG